MAKRQALFLDFDIKAQPDEVTCGPTCLHALYQYYKDDISLSTVIQQVKRLKYGGTLPGIEDKILKEKLYDTIMEVMLNKIKAVK